jgi:hypothetical protein
MHQLHYGVSSALALAGGFHAEIFTRSFVQPSGDFGGYLYLITCRRVCFLCFTEKPDYLPLLRADAIRKFGLHNEHTVRLPAMKTVPA